MPSKKIFLIAGEASGDFHGAHLVTALKKIFPSAQFRGLGGAQMKEAGVEILYDLPKEAVLGLGDVLKKYFLFQKIFNLAFRDVQKFAPDAIILIDYPGFNLRFAKKIKLKFPVLYYISPQVWAWGKNRLESIKRTVSHMIVFFDFEEALYKKEGIPVTWVGHPLAGHVKPSRSRNELRNTWLGTKNSEVKAIALFPGSRKTEVERILPEMLEVSKRISASRGTTVFFLGESNTLPESLYSKILTQANISFEIKRLRNSVYDIFFASDFAMVSSGTATLEAALTSIPFVIFYKTAWSTFFLGRRLIQIPYIGLVNVVAQRKIVPEFIQQEIKTETIAHEAKYLLDHQDLRERMILALKEVEQKLGPSGAETRAAEAVAHFLEACHSDPVGGRI